MTDTKRNIEIRAFSSELGDREKILNLMKRVFSVDRTINHFTWKFLNNPYHSILTVVAQDTSIGELVASYAVMPIKLNIMGRSVLACQSLDTMVHPDYRMMGLFERTAIECYQLCQSAGMMSVHGFPGPMSYPGFMRKLAWRRVATLDEFSLKLCFRNEIRRLLRFGLASSLVNRVFQIGIKLREQILLWLNYKRCLIPIIYETADKLPADYDIFWKKIKDFEVFSIWKDSEYLSWRIDQNPDSKFTYHILRSEGSIVAMAITTVRRETVYICEWLVLEKARVISDMLLSHVSLHHQSGVSVRRIVFEGFDSGFFREAFRRLKREYRSQYVFGLARFEGAKDLQGLELPFNWTITLGDVDFA